VRAPGKFSVVAKDHLTLVDSYLNTSTWTSADLANHQTAVARIVNAGRGDLLSHVPSAVSSTAQPGQAQLPQAAAEKPAQKSGAAEEPHKDSIFDFPNK
jgi:hypothetical protein